MSTFPEYGRLYISLGHKIGPVNQFGCPLTKHGYKDGTKNINQADIWDQIFSEPNIGIVTGSENGLFVLSCYYREKVDVGLNNLLTLLRYLKSDTLMSYTSNKLYAFLHSPIGLALKTNLEILPGVHLTGDGSYVIAPPSKLASGAVYEWADESSYIEDAPQVILDLVTKPKPKVGKHC